MANLPETSQWEPGIYQLETTDPVVGGTPNVTTGAGKSNIPQLLLANRTKYLKDTFEASGLGVDVIPGAVVADFNTPTIGGRYKANAGASNAPLAGAAFLFDHKAGSAADEASQLAEALSSGRQFWRAKLAGTWQAWRELAIFPDATAGLLARAATGAPIARSLAAGTGIVVTNGNGQAGNPSVAVDLTGAFGSNIGQSGWQKLPSGLIMQWGSTNSIAQGSSVLVTFPITFPNAFLQAVVSSVASFDSTNSYSVSTRAETLSGMRITNNSGTSGIAIGRWFALGN